MRWGGPKGGLQDFGSVAMVTSLLMRRGDNCRLLLLTTFMAATHHTSEKVYQWWTKPKSFVKIESTITKQCNSLRNCNQTHNSTVGDNELTLEALLNMHQ